MNPDTIKILIVDDDHEAHDLLALILKSPDFEPIFAYDVESAFEQWKAHKEQVRLVLLDIGLPGPDGFQLIRLIRDDETNREVPFIAMTAMSTPQIIQEAQSNGCAKFLSKPFSPSKLVDSIRTVIESVPTR